MRNDKKVLKEVKQITPEEKIEREFNQYKRDINISRMRASVVRSQIIRAYEILENIRLDYINDTMFRDYFTRAKIELEGALGDFLLDDNYWKDRKKKVANMSLKEYSDGLSE